MSIARPSLWPQVLSCVATLLGGFVLAPLALVHALGSPEEAFYALREGGTLPFGVNLLVSLVLAVLVPIAATRQLPIVGFTLLPWLTGCVMALVAASGFERAALRAHRSGALARSSYVGGAIAAAVLLAMLAFHIGTSLAARTVAADVNDFPVAQILTP